MMKFISLSLVTTAMLVNASETNTLEPIRVVETANSKIVKDVSDEQLKSADLAEALSKNVPSVSIVRRSGIANDIILRGQKKDNINILLDAAKIYGACPNRMDSATSHVLSNNVQNVKVIEGPYDVENFGTLSGLVKVETKEPTKDVHGEVNLNAGSFGYKKASATVSGGTDRVKLLVSTSTEEGDQYKDGNGDTFAEQQVKKGMPGANQYSNPNQKAYEKKTLLTKGQFNINDDQELKLSYTGNRSDNILYPTGTMDADYDDSNIYTVGYTARNLGSFSKQLDLDYYYSDVDHPMSTALRVGSPMMGTYYTSVAHYKTSIHGEKIKNIIEVADSLVTIGLDTSVRNWKGENYYINRTTGVVNPGTPMNPNAISSLASTDTTNKAIFSKVEKSFGKLDLEVGTRYDYTDVDSSDSTKTDKKYVGLNANIFGVYNVDEKMKYFAGIGKSTRVPDARELYTTGMGAQGNAQLDDVKNYEADLGFDKTIGNFNIRPKIFYSVLKDYIYNTGTKFENIDAKIYGLDISGLYAMTDNLSLDYGVAYQKGKKDGDFTDKDLAEIPPLKGNFALNYEMDKAKYTAEVVAVDSWNNFDSSAREQELAGYALFNLKYNNQLHKNIGLTLGVDNVFDKVYNSTNTYQDITYATVGSDRVLINDPGRYGYVNLKYSF